MRGTVLRSVGPFPYGEMTMVGNMKAGSQTSVYVSQHPLAIVW